MTLILIITSAQFHTISENAIVRMLPTPDTSHVSYDRVYEPAEDSYLLLDTLVSASETKYLHQRFDSGQNNATPVILEVGPGSGVVLAFATAHSKAIFGRSDVLTLGCDINNYACVATAETANRAIAEIKREISTASISHGQFIDVLNGDLTTCLLPHSIDVLIFNPPYVPSELPDLTKHDQYNSVKGKLSSTEIFERDSHMLALSYAGGEDGMVVTNRLLDQLPGILSTDRGVAYVLLCAQNKPELIKQRIKEWGSGWSAETVASSGRKAGWEKLCVIRIGRS